VSDHRRNQKPHLTVSYRRPTAPATSGPPDSFREIALRGFLRVRVCILTVVIPGDPERASECDCQFQKWAARFPGFYPRLSSSSDISGSEEDCTIGHPGKGVVGRRVTSHLPVIGRQWWNKRSPVCR
jgi:hypothetical protein